jgi:opacity protein-like surface antigen
MKRILMCAAALVAFSATNAQAQMSMGSFHGYLTGHIGGVLGGDVSDVRTSGGVSVSMQESTGWGAEVDFGHASSVNVNSVPLDITTYMVNMTFVTPYQRIRPFASAGGGLSQVSGCVACGHDAKTFDLGLSAGAGVFVLTNDVIAIRADARYFWSGAEHPDLGRPDNLTHWRLSIGLTYLWTVAP